MALYHKLLLSTYARVRSVADRLTTRVLGGEARPPFYDVESTCPGLLAIDRNYETIREELLPLLPRVDEIPCYHEVDAAQELTSNASEKAWRVFFLHMLGAPEDFNQDLCPRTTAIVRGIPNVLGAFFSILEPGKEIPAHRTHVMTYLRYHTAFVVPEKFPPTIRVKGQPYTWKEGESVLLDASLEHEVANRSDGYRVVLIVDVWRPLPKPLHWLNLFAGWLFVHGTQKEEWRDAIEGRRLNPLTS